MIILKPLVSIITPTYNRARLLIRLWSSLNKQKFTNFEWIIIDDGSTDDTKKKIEKLNDERIKYFNQPNKGVNAARLEAEKKFILIQSM